MEKKHPSICLILSSSEETQQEQAYLQLSGQGHPGDVYWLRVVAVTGVIGGLRTENKDLTRNAGNLDQNQEGSPDHGVKF